MPDANWRKNLRYYREKAGKKQADIAKLLDVKQQTIAAYENGTANPPVYNLVRITKYLGITMTELFSDTKPLDVAKNKESPNQEPPAESRLYEHLKALADIYEGEISQIRNRLKIIEVKSNQGSSVAGSSFPISK